MTRRWRGWRFLSIALSLLVSMPLASQAAQPDTPIKAPSLLKAWLAFPAVERVAWPYAYIRVQSTDERLAGNRQDLFAEFKHLTWRLENSDYEKLDATVQAWQDKLAQTQHYRASGLWSPAWLLSHPDKNPPVSRIVAIGSCEVPAWVEVWDANGIHRFRWQAGMRLSDLLDRTDGLTAGQAGEVDIVTPTGEIGHYGIAAWNYADTDLSPGMRIIATLPLKGEAFVYIRDSIARLLAHSPPGDDCRETRIEQGARNG